MIALGIAVFYRTSKRRGVLHKTGLHLVRTRWYSVVQRAFQPNEIRVLEQRQDDGVTYFMTTLKSCCSCTIPVVEECQPAPTFSADRN